MVCMPKGFQTPAIQYAALPLSSRRHPKSYKQSCFELTVMSVSIPLIGHVAQLFFVPPNATRADSEECITCISRPFCRADQAATNVD
jgi:hypothetical protein